MGVDKEFIKSAFYNLYQRKWKAQGKSQEEFAEAVRAIDPECGINKSYVSKLLNGHKAPSARYLQDFGRVLGVALEDFYPSTYEDKYRYSSEYQDAVEDWKKETAEKSFGLNLSLLYGLKQLIDFDSEFPAYAPLQCVAADPENGFPFSLKYEREEFAKAAEGSKGKSLFQILSRGEVVSLGPADMKYLKMIQNYLVRKVREQFAHHKQELIDSANEATEQCKDYLQPGKKISLGKDPLPPETLQKIDRWGIYTVEEKEKYRIPDPPEELPYTAAYKEKDSEIHLGRGALPLDELRKYFEGKRGDRKNEAEQSGDGPGLGGSDPGGMTPSATEKET